VADHWFQLKDNLNGLEYSNEGVLWYLDDYVVVPLVEARRREVEETHNLPFCGHLRKHKVTHQGNLKSWWPGWRKDGKIKYV
jgi:hypothetical protein